MPGCLGIDALWQLVGFYLGWLGSSGRGRALGVGEVKFIDQVLPTVKRLVYGIDLKRVFRGKLVLGIADGWVEADGRRIYEAKDLRVGAVSTPKRHRRPGEIHGPFGHPRPRAIPTKSAGDRNEARRGHRHGDRLGDRQ